MIIGDFNLVINPEQDRLNSVYNNWKAHEVVCSWMEDCSLEDVWRNRNENVKRYSWYSSRIKAASRIDFVFVDMGLCDQVVNCDYTTGLQTDHSPIFLALDVVKNESGALGG